MFQNRLAVLINSAYFEHDLRKHLKRRADYQKLLDFFTVEEEGEGVAYDNFFNNDNRVNDIVRAIYFTSQTVFRGKGLEQRGHDGRERFLNALRSMNYEVESAYNSIDAHFVVKAIQIAQSGTVDTIVVLGLTVDHVPLIWALRGAGVRVIGMFASTYDVSERLKQAVDWYYQLKVEDGFLTGELPSSDNSASDQDEEDEDEDDSEEEA